MQQNIPSAATWWRLADTPDQTEMFFCVFFLILSINHIISQSRQPCQLGTDADWQAISGQVLELSQNKISKWEKKWRPCSKGWNVNILKNKKKQHTHTKKKQHPRGEKFRGGAQSHCTDTWGKVKRSCHFALHYHPCLYQLVLADNGNVQHLLFWIKSKGHYVNSIVLQFH